MFASWRKVSENLSVVLHYGVDLTINSIFLKKRFRRVYCFFERTRITFYKIGKVVFTERYESPNSFAASRLKIRSRSRTRGRNI